MKKPLTRLKTRTRTKQEQEQEQEQKVVLGTPEIFKEGKLNSTVLSMIEKNQINRIVFDEAHTIISWGNSFSSIIGADRAPF